MHQYYRVPADVKNLYTSTPHHTFGLKGSRFLGEGSWEGFQWTAILWTVPKNYPKRDLSVASVKYLDVHKICKNIYQNLKQAIYFSMFVYFTESETLQYSSKQPAVS